MAPRGKARSSAACILALLVCAGLGLTPYLHTCLPWDRSAAECPALQVDRPDSTHPLDADCVACILASQARTDLAAGPVTIAPSEPIREVAADACLRYAAFTHQVLYARPPPLDA